jgi:hypothetical protein
MKFAKYIKKLFALFGIKISKIKPSPSFSYVALQEKNIKNLRNENKNGYLLFSYLETLMKGCLLIKKI